MSQQQPPPDPKAITPGRFWYWIAGIVIVVGIGAGITVFVLGVTSLAGAAPKMETVFDSGDSATVELSPDRDYAIYIEHPGDTTPPGECSVDGPGAATVDTPTNTSFTAGDGRYTWHLLYELEVTEKGEYRVACESADALYFAVGDAVDVGGFVGGVFGTIGGLIGIPCFGLVVGGGIILLVALRRNANRKRLLRGEGPPKPTHPDAPGAW